MDSFPDGTGTWRAVDPEREIQRLAEKRVPLSACPLVLVDEYHLVVAPDGFRQFVHIAVSTECGPFPVQADLGRRIAGMIHADAAQGASD